MAACGATPRRTSTRSSQVREGGGGGAQGSPAVWLPGGTRARALPVLAGLAASTGGTWAHA